MPTEFFLSQGAIAGTDNTNPNLSLGGNLTTTRIVTDRFNNLFRDTTEDEIESGITIERVIYIKNTGTQSLVNGRVYFADMDNYTSMQLSEKALSVPEDLLNRNPGSSDPPSETEKPVSYFLAYEQPISDDGSGGTSSHFLSDTNIRVASRVTSVSHPAYNQVPNKVGLVIRKDGNPTGIGKCKVWSSSGSERYTIGEVDVSTLLSGTTNVQSGTVWNDFVNLQLGPSDRLDIGDFIGFELLSATDSNKVRVFRKQSGEGSLTDIFGAEDFRFRQSDNTGGSRWNRDDQNSDIMLRVFNNITPCQPGNEPTDPGNVMKPHDYDTGLVLTTPFPSGAFKGIIVEQVFPPGTAKDEEEKFTIAVEGDFV